MPKDSDAEKSKAPKPRTSGASESYDSSDEPDTPDASKYVTVRGKHGVLDHKKSKLYLSSNDDSSSNNSLNGSTPMSSSNQRAKEKVFKSTSAESVKKVGIASSEKDQSKPVCAEPNIFDQKKPRPRIYSSDDDSSISTLDTISFNNSPEDLTSETSNDEMGKEKDPKSSSVESVKKAGVTPSPKNGQSKQDFAKPNVLVQKKFKPHIYSTDDESPSSTSPEGLSTSETSDHEMGKENDTKSSSTESAATVGVTPGQKDDSKPVHAEPDVPDQKKPKLHLSSSDDASSTNCPEDSTPDSSSYQRAKEKVFKSTSAESIKKVGIAPSQKDQSKPVCAEPNVFDQEKPRPRIYSSDDDSSISTLDTISFNNSLEEFTSETSDDEMGKEEGPKSSSAESVKKAGVAPSPKKGQSKQDCAKPNVRCQKKDPKSSLAESVKKAGVTPSQKKVQSKQEYTKSNVSGQKKKGPKFNLFTTEDESSATTPSTASSSSSSQVLTPSESLTDAMLPSAHSITCDRTCRKTLSLGDLVRALDVEEVIDRFNKEYGPSKSLNKSKISNVSVDSKMRTAVSPGNLSLTEQKKISVVSRSQSLDLKRKETDASEENDSVRNKTIKIGSKFRKRIPRTIRSASDEDLSILRTRRGFEVENVSNNQNYQEQYDKDYSIFKKESRINIKLWHQISFNDFFESEIYYDWLSKLNAKEQKTPNLMDSSIEVLKSKETSENIVTHGKNKKKKKKNYKRR